MAHQETQILTATAADVAADMAYHRTSWASFRTLMKWTAVGCTVILIALFFIFK